MRDLHTTLLKAITADMYRLEDYVWRDAIEKVIELSTVQERLDFVEELKKIEWEFIQAKVSAMLMTNQVTETKGDTYSSSPSPSLISPRLIPLPLNPRQLELDL